ncbi:type-2 ice-structuring protein-like [Enoplosus armatus]|uniref:type-2 ice-structuring protein-like n=1 Tax=Enoplosus armatus TaxID=215367 RepID=UPI003992D55B
MKAASLLVCAVMALIGAADAMPGERTGPFHEEGNCYKSARTSCPTGWTGYNGRCFHYVPTARTWADAEINCQFYGGNLASVHSLDEHHEIQNMILKTTETYPLTWIGGSDAVQQNTWLWSDGTPFKFNYWAPGQPDHRESAHCVLMNFGDEKKFDDQPCSYTKPYVCAKKL